MSINIQFLCDRIDCEQVLDVYAGTADAEGVTWAVREASDSGWIVAPDDGKLGSRAYCPEHSDPRQLLTNDTGTVPDA